MSIENVTTQASVTPAAPPTLDTSSVEDFGTRVFMVQQAAQEESRAAQREEANTEAETSETPAETQSADDSSTEIETPEVVKPAVETPAVAAAPSEPGPEEKARKVALANAARLEREAVHRRAELASKAAELKAKEQTFAEREAKLVRLEKSFTDPDALLDLLAEKVTPEKMSQFFIEQGDPSKVAERRAKAEAQAAQEPISAEIKQLREELEAMRKIADESKQVALEHEAKARRASSEKDFSERVVAIKEKVPHAARLLQKRPKEFFAMADMAANELMEIAKVEGKTATWDDVIYNINKQLLDFTKDLQDEGSPATPSTPEKSLKPNAAAKASTVSNRAASERSAILQDDEKWDGLPFDERVRRAEKRARQG